MVKFSSLILIVAIAAIMAVFAGSEFLAVSYLLIMVGMFGIAVSLFGELRRILQ
jgi:hypothetical protein